MVQALTTHCGPVADDIRERLGAVRMRPFTDSVDFTLDGRLGARTGV